MRSEIIKSKIFERRALLLGAGQLLLTSSLVGRLYYLEIIKSEEFKTLSDSNRIKIMPVLPFRGRIFDRNGKAMAENTSYYRAMFDHYGNKEALAIMEKLYGLLEFSEEKRGFMRKKFSENHSREPFLVEEYLTWNQVSKLEVNKPDLPGIYIETGQVRNYPYSLVSAHLIGYLGPVKDETGNSVLLSIPDFKVGKNGVEKTAESLLRGKPGIKKVEVNVHGLPVRELSIEESQSGNDLQLTIDADLQEFAVKRMAGLGGVSKEGGGAVCIDIETGDVLAMASTPGFDTNQFIRGIPTDIWEELRDNPDVPMINKTIASQYPPGSTFKTGVALAALEAGTITESTTFFCPGYYMLGSRRFDCWKKEGHGSLSVRDALCHSCDVFFYNTAQRLGVDKIAEMSFKLGYGTVTGIELPGEKPGLIPSKEWKRRTYNKDWMAGETINTGIGQGYVLTTPLQLALACARIASGGKKVIPRLIKTDSEYLKNVQLENIDDERLVNRLKELQKPFDDIPGISQRNLNVVKEGMEMVVNQLGGTAYMSRINIPEFAMAGKTGTAQVRSQAHGADSSKEPDKKYRNHGLFIAYAPIQAPRYAVGVVIEHGSHGATTAAPVGRDILLKIQEMRADVKPGSDSENKEGT